MNKLNRKIEYALISLRHMSQKRPGELTTAKEIVDIYKSPFDATSRVLQILVQKQVLRSVQGAQGGYQIIKDLSRYSLHDLITILLGPVGVTRCMSSREQCEMQQNCNISGPLHVLNQKLIEFYQSINIRDLIEGKIKTESPHVPKLNEVHL